MSDKLITLENLKTFRNKLSDVAVSGSYNDLEDRPDAATKLEIDRLFRTEYAINVSVTNGYVAESSDTTIWSKETATVSVVANSGYVLPNEINVSGAQYIYEKETGLIGLYNATDGVSISVVCEGEQPAGLMPFNTSTPVNGFDFGPNAINGQVSDEIESFLASLSYENMTCTLMRFGPSAGGLIAAEIEQDGKLEHYLVANTDESETIFVYATAPTSAFPFPIDFQGWHGLVNGKLYSIRTDTPYSIENYGDWNGNLAGSYILPLEPFFEALPSVGADGTTYGFDFGNVQNGDINNALESFLGNLTYDNGEVILLATAEEKETYPMLKAIDLSASGVASGYGILNAGIIGSEGLVYSTVGIPSMGIVRGYNGLTAGKIVGSEAIRTTVVNDPRVNPIWNGIFIGRIEAIPSTLTPFEVGQTISAIDFGNVSNGDTNSDLDAFLGNLTYDGYNKCSLVGDFSASRPGVDFDYTVYATSENGYYNLYVDRANYGDDFPVLVYSTDGSGYQNLTDGKVELFATLNPVNISEVEGWNGVFIGAVEYTRPLGRPLEPIVVDSTPTSIKFNENLTAEEIAEFIKNDQVWRCSVLVNFGLESGQLSAVVNTYYDDNLGYGVINISDGDTVIYRTDTGWQEDFTVTGYGGLVTYIWDKDTHTATFQIPITTPIYYVDEFSNGLLFGVVPQPTGLTPFAVGDTVYGLDFGDVQNGTTSNVMDSFLSNLAYEKGDNQPIMVVSHQGNEYIYIEAVRDSQKGIYMLNNYYEPTDLTKYATLYSTNSGFQGLVDGKYYAVSGISVSSVSRYVDPTLWNGVLVGNVSQ